MIILQEGNRSKNCGKAIDNRNSTWYTSCVISNSTVSIDDTRNHIIYRKGSDYA